MVTFNELSWPIKVGIIGGWLAATSFMIGFFLGLLGL